MRYAQATPTAVSRQPSAIRVRAVWPQAKRGLWPMFTLLEVLT
ncbi:hypothetical protein [Moorena sp. SIO3F7]|nr:hypothetical protein [Moorena sp. SIO3F7]